MGQDFQIGGFDTDCGTWVKDTVTLSDWEVIDTINFDPNASDEWVYTGWETSTSNWTHLVYCPCGCGDPDYRVRKRINRQGIRQKQTEKTSYRYVPEPLSDYDKVMEKINERTPKDTTSLTSFGPTVTGYLYADTLVTLGSRIEFQKDEGVLGVIAKKDYQKLTSLTVNPSFTPKTDTVEVWINFAEIEDRGLITYNISLKGWEVRTPKWIPAHWDENDAYIWGYWEVEKSYLNHFKQPLTGYIVWQTKEVEK
jgi:hypothetical protein